MKSCLAVSVAGVLLLATSATAAPTPPAIAKQMRTNLAYQIALEGENFSPGLIDGKWGPRSDLALKEWTAAKLPGVSTADKKMFDTLKPDLDGALTTYTITADDAALVGMLPDDWNEKAKLDLLPYPSMQECILEKFHCSAGLLQTLNPGQNLARISVGDTLNVPNVKHPLDVNAKVRSLPRDQQADHLSIDVTAKVIRAYNKDGTQIALFECSVAKDKGRLPVSDTTIKEGKMAVYPGYTFNPKYWPEVTSVTHILNIPWGPRNPVGLVWMELNDVKRPDGGIVTGLGMHGTPKPEMIGKTGSHGCFRMTNWDALTLYAMVHEGLIVKIINPEKADTPAAAGAP